MKEILNNKKWPNFFIVGAARAGTTSLYNFLKSTEGIFMSPVKETGHFIPNDSRGYNDEKKYLDLFKEAKNEKVLGEATPGYLTTPETPELIKMKVPYAKILITIRDPIERTFSLYLNRVRQGLYSLPFDDAVNDYLIKKQNTASKDLEKIIHGSSYSQHVKRYLDTFGTKQVKIIIFEEFMKEPNKILLEIIEFLGLETNPPDTVEKNNSYAKPLGSVGEYIVRNRVINNLAKRLLPNLDREEILRIVLNKKSKKPLLSIETRKKLFKIFVDDESKLKLLLKRDLPWKEPLDS